MGRKTRILRRLDKFGVKYANHPLLRNKKETSAPILNSLVIEELPLPIEEEALESEEKPIIEEKIEISRPAPIKKAIKPKK